MFINTKEYNYQQAVELVHAKIASDFVSFPIDTEFGRVLIEVNNKQDKDKQLYRYETVAWKRAPITEYTKSIIRDNSYAHYVSIAKVKSYEIQRLMVAMALMECLIRYITDDDEINADTDIPISMAAQYAKYSHGDLFFTPGNLAHEYMRTLPNSIFRKNDSVNREFMKEYFKSVAEKSGAQVKRDKKWAEKHRIKVEGWYDSLLLLVFNAVCRHYEIKFVEYEIKEERKTKEYSRYYELKEETYKAISLPDAMRYIVTGKD